MAFLWKSPNSKFWIAGFKDTNGKRRNRSTKVPFKGPNPTVTKKNRTDAQKLADSYEDASRRQRTVLQARRVIMDLTEEFSGVSIAEKSLRSHLEDWLDRKRPEVAPSTLQFYTAATKRFLDSMEAQGLADRDIACVTREHITSFRNERSKQVQPKTVNHELKSLRTIFRDAKRDNLISDDPTEFVQTVKGKNDAGRRPFTLDELRALLAVADEEWKSMILFGVYTGQRVSDIAKLTWRNLDLAEEEIRLVTGKTGKRLSIPIAAPLLEHIENLPVSDDPDQPLHPRSFDMIKRHGRANNLSNKFSNLLYEAGLRDSKVSHRKRKRTDDDSNEPTDARKVHALSFHSLRHTAVTMLHEAGVPPAVVQQLIGHDNSAVHNAYIGVGRDARVEAAKKFPNLLA